MRRETIQNRSADTDKMNELSFSITLVNNLLKLVETVEAEFGYSDSITVELDETKLCSCSCGCVIGDFGCKVRLAVLFFFFFFSLEHIFLVVDHHP